MSNTIQTLLKEHPTLLLTFSYFIITVIGVLYSYFFYQVFGINILKFADLSDFLLASILEPRSVVIFIAMVICSVVGFYFDLKVRKKVKWYGRFTQKFMVNRWMSKYADPLGVMFIMLSMSYYLIHELAVKNAQVIKSGTFDAFEVRFSDPDEQSGAQPLAVLGSSSRYGYFYDAKTESSFVVPLENISFMRKEKAIEQTKPEESKLKAKP